MSWRTIRMRYLAELNPTPSPHIRADKDVQRPLYPMESIHEFGPLGKPQLRTTADLLTGYSYIDQGDVAFAKVTPCFENGKGLLGAELVEASFATSEVTVLRPGSGVEQRFLAYVLQSSDFREPAMASMSGAGGLRRVSEQFVRDYPVNIPSEAEQRKVADYLDRETAEIDAFIEDQEKLISLDAERKTSEWADAYSKLSRFGCRRVKQVVRSLVDGPFGSALTSNHYADSGAPVVRLGNIGVNEFKLEPRAYVDLEYAKKLSYHRVVPGDVVIGGLGDGNHPLGRSAVVPSEFGAGIVKADCYRARVGREVGPEYLAWALSSPQSAQNFAVAGRGSTRARLNLDIVSNSSIPVPPLEVQRWVVDEYFDSDRNHAELAAAAQRAIDLAKERRSALISAAVTGQIDVTNL